jgi:hypothetical protein
MNNVIINTVPESEVGISPEAPFKKPSEIVTIKIAEVLLRE